MVNIPQKSSSDLSVQSAKESHCCFFRIQWLLPHRNWLGMQMANGKKARGQISDWHNNLFIKIKMKQHKFMNETSCGCVSATIDCHMNTSQWFKMNVFQTIHNTTMVFSSLHDAHNKPWLIIKWIKLIIWANSLSCLTNSVNNSESFYWFIRQTIDLFAYVCFEDCKLTIQHCLFSTQHFSLILSVLHSSGFTYFCSQFCPSK